MARCFRWLARSRAITRPQPRGAKWARAENSRRFWSSDVVGYSRLAGTDEDRTLARLRGLRSDLIDPTIAAHHGRIIKRTGDGSIIEFRSVVDAVSCAIEVQTGMVERNAGLSARKSYRVSHRHSSWRRCRGSRRRPHGRRRECRGPARRDLRAGPDLSVRRRLPAGQVPARASGGRPRAAKPQEHRRAGARLLLRHGAPAAQKAAQAATASAASGRAGPRWPPRLLSCFLRRGPSPGARATRHVS